jgi:Bacterial PH domain
MVIPSLPPPEITAELDRNERVIWSGRPRHGPVLRWMDAFAIPFGLLWTGIPLVGAWAAVTGPKGNPIAIIAPLPFVLIGLYLIVGRFFIDAAQRRRTFYALTDERILIVSGILSRNIRSVALRTLDQVDLSARASGQGTISFGRSMYGSFALPGWPGMKSMQPPMFEMIPDAAVVAKLIRDAQRAANAPAARGG